MRLEGWKAGRFEAWKSVCRSQLRTLLHPGGKRWWEKVDGHWMVGGSDGGREHQGGVGGGELQRLLAGAAPLHGRKVDNDLGALHGRMKSRHHQGCEIST